MIHWDTAPDSPIPPGPVPDADVRFEPATSYSIDDLVELFNRSFEGYLVPLEMTADRLSRMVRSDSVDLATSLVLCLAGRPAGLILVGIRGWSLRVSAMGVVAAGRGHGLGRRLMEAVIAGSEESGIRRMILEVIETNTAARTLYEHLGFEASQRLVGYERPAGDDPPSNGDELKEVDPRKLAKIVEYEAPSNLPWQLAAETIAAAGPPSVALRLEDKAYAMVHRVLPDRAVLTTVLVPHAVRRQGWGLSILRALFARYPGRRWELPARTPENLAPGFFERAGFSRIEMAQLEMIRSLQSGTQR